MHSHRPEVIDPRECRKGDKLLIVPAAGKKRLVIGMVQSEFSGFGKRAWLKARVFVRVFGRWGKARRVQCDKVFALYRTAETDYVQFYQCAWRRAMNNNGLLKRIPSWLEPWWEIARGFVALGGDVEGPEKVEGLAVMGFALGWSNLETQARIANILDWEILEMHAEGLTVADLKNLSVEEVRGVVKRILTKEALEREPDGQENYQVGVDATGMEG